MTPGGISEDWGQEVKNVDNTEVEAGSKKSARREQEAKVEEYENALNLVILFKIKYHSIKLCHKEHILAFNSSD